MNKAVKYMGDRNAQDITEWAQEQAYGNANKIQVKTCSELKYTIGGTKAVMVYFGERADDEFTQFKMYSKASKSE